MSATRKFTFTKKAGESYHLDDEIAFLSHLNECKTQQSPWDEKRDEEDTVNVVKSFKITIEIN